MKTASENAGSSPLDRPRYYEVKHEPSGAINKRGKVIMCGRMPEKVGREF